METFERSYRILSYAFRVRSPLARVGELVHRYLEPFPAENLNGVPTYVLGPSDEDQRYAMCRGEEQLSQASTEAGLVDLILWEVHREALERADDYVSIHAGAVSRDGVGVVLPATMDSGKTTLSGGLVHAGFDYLSDEVALIAPETGHVHPFPKVLTFESPSVELFPGLKEELPPEFAWGSRLRYHIRPSDLRPGAGPGEPCPIRFVISPRYERGSRTRLEPLTRAETAVLLAKNSFNFDRLGGPALHALERAVADAEGYRLSIGNLGEAVEAVEGVVAGAASRT